MKSSSKASSVKAQAGRVAVATRAGPGAATLAPHTPGGRAASQRRCRFGGVRMVVSAAGAFAHSALTNIC